MTPRLSSALHMYGHTCAYILHPRIYIPTQEQTHTNLLKLFFGIDIILLLINDKNKLTCYL